MPGYTSFYVWVLTCIATTGSPTVGDEELVTAAYPSFARVNYPVSSHTQKLHARQAEEYALNGRIGILLQRLLRLKEHKLLSYIKPCHVRLHICHRFKFDRIA